MAPSLISQIKLFSAAVRWSTVCGSARDVLNVLCRLELREGQANPLQMILTMLRFEVPSTNVCFVWLNTSTMQLKLASCILYYIRDWCMWFLLVRRSIVLLFNVTSDYYRVYRLVARYPIAWCYALCRVQCYVKSLVISVNQYNYNATHIVWNKQKAPILQHSKTSKSYPSKCAIIPCWLCCVAKLGLFVYYSFRPYGHCDPLLSTMLSTCQAVIFSELSCTFWHRDHAHCNWLLKILKFNNKFCVPSCCKLG